MPWATIEQVTAMTGVTVDAVTLTQASAMIDTYAGVTEEMPEDSITARDRGHLRKATIWQSAWLSGKPGILTQRETARSTSADSVTITRRADVDVMLAPLAARELRNLSWYSTRSVIVPSIGQRRLPPGINFLNEESDNYHPWRPV